MSESKETGTSRASDDRMTLLLFRSHHSSSWALQGAARGGWATGVHHWTSWLRQVNISSAPGQGKGSAVFGAFRRKEKYISGFVYYEVDCFWFVKNPYVPIDVPEPTMAMESQRDLVGEGRKERQEASVKYEAAQAKEELTDEEEKDVEKYYQLLCQDITAERRRLGGDWAVAGFLNGKRERDLVRRFLGSDLVIVMLRLPESVIRERLVKRHGDDEDTLNYVLVILV